MARYEYQCALCGSGHERTYAMGAAPSRVPCACGAQAHRVYSLRFSEDRTRFRDYRKVLGTDQPPPESFGDLRRIEKEKGIYFDSSLTPQEKKLKEYAQHIKAGGERVDSKEINPPAPVNSKTIRQLMAEKNVKLKP